MQETVPVTAITCTGDRPIQFSVCLKIMLRMNPRPAQWLIVDDGDIPLNKSGLPDWATYIRRLKTPQDNQPRWSKVPMTLSSNLIEGFKHVKYDALAFIEDDDWYPSGYLAAQMKEAEGLEATGSEPRCYFQLAYNRSEEFNNCFPITASLFLNDKKAIALFRQICIDEPKYEGGLDYEFWKAFTGKKAMHSNPLAMSVGMKAWPVSGREGGWQPSHVKTGTPRMKADPDRLKLKQWLPSDEVCWYDAAAMTLTPAFVFMGLEKDQKAVDVSSMLIKMGHKAMVIPPGSDPNRYKLKPTTVAVYRDGMPGNPLKASIQLAVSDLPAADPEKLYSLFDRLAEHQPLPPAPVAPKIPATIPRMPKVLATADIAVAVTCHEPYLKILPVQLAAVDRQTTTPTEKFLILDGCDLPFALPKDWQIIRTDAKSPNPGRTKAAEQTKAAWIVYADADDSMHPDYIAAHADKLKTADPRCGVIYADIVTSAGRKFDIPDKYDFWQLRLHDHITMASCWKAEAVRACGGFMYDGYDDWALALKISRAGWTLDKQVKVPVLYNIHPGGRSQDNTRGFECMWNAHTYGLITLLAGRTERLADWMNYLKKATLPPELTVYVLDNSGDTAFGRKVKEFLCGQTRFKYMYRSYGKPCELKNWTDRHIFVPSLYNQILPYVNDDFAVFLEDDVVPPLHGLETIMKAWDMRGKRIGGISGVYPARDFKDKAVGTADINSYLWTSIYKLKDVQENKLYPSGSIAGGFSVYQNALIKRYLPCYYAKRGGVPCGWDTNLSDFIRGQGYGLRLHGGVQCQHITDDKI